MKKDYSGHVVIECPNTIFYLKINDEGQLTKLHTFMNNIKHIENLSINDIYNWCNRQRVEYHTSFNYNKSLSISKKIISYFAYLKKKQKYIQNITDYSKEA